MYDENISNKAINNLESMTINICNNVIAITSQGYVVNRAKYIKLEWSSILLSAFKNIQVFSEKQQRAIESLYNKLFSL